MPVQRTRQRSALVPSEARSARGGRREATARLGMAHAYLETAQLADSERREGFSNVTASLAVLAGIAACDAICCIRLGRYHRGDDHRQAAELLQIATPDGRELAVRLTRLLGLKDTAHYGASLVSQPESKQALCWATQLVDRAREELER